MCWVEAPERHCHRGLGSEKAPRWGAPVVREGGGAAADEGRKVVDGRRYWDERDGRRAAARWEQCGRTGGVGRGWVGWG